MVGDDSTPTTTDELEQQLAALDHHHGTLLVAQCDVIVELDRRRAWRDDGCTSMAEWLVASQSHAPSHARHLVRVARLLHTHPPLRAVAGRGELSFDQLRLIAPIVTHDNRDELVDACQKLNWAQLVDLIRSLRPIPAKDGQEAHENRRLEFGTDDDGLISRFWGQGPTDQIAQLLGELQRQLEDDPPETVKASSVAARRFDALIRLTRRGGHTTPQRRAPSRADVTIHIDLGVLGGLHPGSGIIPGIGAIPTLVVMKLIDDARLRVVLERDGSTVGIGVAGYRVTDRMFRQLLKRDSGCRFPGCGRRWWLHAHHILAWHLGGPTSLTNLILLCPHHHQLVEKAGWTIRGSPDTTVHFTAPNGHTLAA